MDDVAVKVFAALLGVSEAVRRDGTVTALRSRIVILPSLMGGGKAQYAQYPIFHIHIPNIQDC